MNRFKIIPSIFAAKILQWNLKMSLEVNTCPEKKKKKKMQHFIEKYTSQLKLKKKKQPTKEYTSE